jgi:hypothetical protein
MTDPVGVFAIKRQITLNRRKALRIHFSDCDRVKEF